MCILAVEIHHLSLHIHMYMGVTTIITHQRYGYEEIITHI